MTILLFLGSSLHKNSCVSISNKCKHLVQLFNKMYVYCDATMTETHTSLMKALCGGGDVVHIIHMTLPLPVQCKEQSRNNLCNLILV